MKHHASRPLAVSSLNQTLSRITRAQSTQAIASQSLIARGFQEQGGELEYQVWLETLDVIRQIKRNGRV